MSDSKEFEKLNGQHVDLISEHQSNDNQIKYQSNLETNDHQSKQIDLVDGNRINKTNKKKKNKQRLTDSNEQLKDESTQKSPLDDKENSNREQNQEKQLDQPPKDQEKQPDQLKEQEKQLDQQPKDQEKQLDQPSKDQEKLDQPPKDQEKLDQQPKDQETQPDQQLKEQEIQEEQIKLEQQLNDKMIDNMKNDDKTNESVNIKIDTPADKIEIIKPATDAPELTTNDEIKKLIDNENTRSSKVSKKEFNQNNGKSSDRKIPDLLLTENNRPNNANKLLIGAILIFKFVTYFIIKIIELFHPTKRNKTPPINEPLLLLSAGEITERIKNNQLKCEQVIRAYINRIEIVQPKLNAMIDNCFEIAINRAKEIDEQLKDPQLAVELKKLPLLGVPFTCKDSISIKGLALTAGVKIRKGIKADRDATVIKNLRAAGAIPLGLTNTPELVLWCDSDNNLYGRTNNPYDLSRIVGGSSGGEGCLISAAGSIFGVGSDVAGSVRIPAMFCGVFGHKTIKKYVPVDEMFPAPPKTYETFICYGPICRYARDIPLALKAMGGSLTDELNLDQEVDFRKIKIYYMEHDGGNPLSSFVDQRILNSMQKVIKYFKEQYGMEAERININKFKYSLAYFGTVCVKGDMKIEDYVSRTGHLNVYWELFKTLFGKSDVTRPILIQILNQSSPYCNPNSSSYRRFTKMLEELKPKVHDMLGDNAVLMMPTWPTIAPKHQTTILRGFDAAYTSIMNALEIPATHCPVGLTKEEGLPLGFTVAAAPGRDRITIAFAKEIEKQFNGWVPPSSTNAN